ncbi:MAG: gluconate 2-dehydrogenase subunit 3 family protein [Acidobacteriaceae bacterium]|nr:gluconate 2-dehydrogenase subunit 3 family protein [Acidobacteriaceae bacterium]
MTRRDLVYLLVRSAALPGATGFFTEWLRATGNQHAHSGSAPPEPDYWSEYQPKFFSAEDFSALQAFTEILIPTDEAPGAREAYCAYFIDFVLQTSAEYASGTQQRWRKAMAALKEAGFHAADEKGRAVIVAQISLPERDPAARHPAFTAYKLVKRETAFAFYTSRAGIIEALDYHGDTYHAVFPACEHPEHHVV